jgi:hypothetical protein
MVCVAILLCLVLGAALACAAAKIPSHVVALERCGGALLVLSLALLGGSLHYYGVDYGVAHGPAPELKMQLMGAATYWKAGARDRIITVAAPGASPAAASW